MEYKQWHFKNQKYEGTVLGDSFHGNGIYKWDNSKVYEGPFYSNFKEGYALLSMANNSNFEGLFIKNNPFGPGILTYSNGRQDVGFWMGQKLVRLSRPVDYIIPRLAPSIKAKLKLLRFRRMISLEEPIEKSVTDILEKYSFKPSELCSPHLRSIHDTDSLFFDFSFYNKNYLSEPFNLFNVMKINNTFIDESTKLGYERKSNLCYYKDSLAEDNKSDELNICVNKESLQDIKIGILKYYTMNKNSNGLENSVFDEEFTDFAHDNECTIVKIEGPETMNKDPPKIVSWNRGDLCSEIVKQIYKHRAFEDKLNFKITELMAGERTAFRKTGEKERKCLYFLKMCFLGPLHVIKELLCDYEISENLMDGRGNNGLMFAAAGDQTEIIDILTDYGMDVNAFNDENLTPLNLCLLRRLAVENNLGNWETAFLLPDSDQYDDEKSQLVDINESISIQSLDRIFGDGMSIDDNVHVIVPSAIAVTSTKEQSPGQENSIIHKSYSQITILNFKSFIKNREKTFDENETNPSDASLLTGIQNPTVDAKRKNKPKSHRREEYEKSVGHSVDDKYFFDLHLSEILPLIPEKDQKERNKTDKSKKFMTNFEVIVEDKVDVQILKKLAAIDETIDKLLSRGADPNSSDVPIPVIHLGIFTHNPQTVDSLLFYGADPNHRLNVEEGYLTPLHVLVLLKPRLEHIQICQILLNSGADPECETHPNFSVRNEENDFLNPQHGRTPLQLICMRPDIEYGDPLGHVISLGILLAEVTNKNHFFNGHSGLTLAMLHGNTRLLEAFLKARCFDPNQSLPNWGTPLHVLVSTFFQKKTLYENSTKMIDLLLNAGADPLLKPAFPSLQLGNCIQYGYQEVEVEKARRKTGQKGKTGAKPEKGEMRDYLKDHIKILEYLIKKQEEKQGYSFDHEELSNTISKKTKTDGTESRKKDGLANKDLVQAKNGQIKEEGNEINDVKGSLIATTETMKSNVTDSAKPYYSISADKIKKAENQKNIKKPGKISQRLNSDYTTSDKKENDNFKKSQKRDFSDSRSEIVPDRKTIEQFSRCILKSLLKLFGDCANLDLNLFTLPYVVLRNGNFYYKFHGAKTSTKEQYSLI